MSDNFIANDQINEYTINITKDTYYFISWNDRYSGNGLTTSDIYVSAVYEGGSGSDAPFTRVDSAWSDPRHFVSNRNGVWVDDSFTASTQINYYSFNVISGSTYYVWWNDRYSGNGTKTTDVYVTAQYSTGSSSEAPFTRVDSAWGEPRSFTATSTGTVTLSVSGGIGSYAVAYRTTSLRP